ncbi:hypothetical protein I3700191H1_00120 [Megasphaera massiliensis]
MLELQWIFVPSLDILNSERAVMSPLVPVCSESAASLPRKEYALWEEKLQKKLLGSEKSIGN